MSSGAGHRRSSFFARRLSSASLLTLSSVHTVLPQYSAVDNDERSIQVGFDAPPAFEEPDQSLSYLADQEQDSPLSNGTRPSTNAPTFPSQDNIVNPRHSILLTPTIIGVLDANTPLAGRSQPDSSEFQYSYPIRSSNSWATLQLYTRDSVPGNPKPSRLQPKIPRLWSCDPLKGVIQLDIESPQVIQHISVVVRFTKFI